MGYFLILIDTYGFLRITFFDNFQSGMAEFTTNYISRGDPNFPSLLNDTKDCPFGLYYKGNFCAERLSRVLAVVGTRHNTRYTLEVLHLLFPELVSKKITIISGFMYGVDYESHLQCLDLGGYTVAVLPYGIDFEPPPFMKNLYMRILSEGGALVSEYPYKHPPEKWTFIARNRIVAGLSHGVLIVEASCSSGSLITARRSQEYGRRVLAVPGAITNSVSVGTNILIKDGLNGFPVVAIDKVQDIFEALENQWNIKKVNEQEVFDFYLRSKPTEKRESLISVEEGSEFLPNVFDVSGLLKFVKLNSGVTSDRIQELIPELKLHTTNLIYGLTKLQIDGYIVEEGGRYYAC
jgi:DNA processing protein